MNIAPSNRRSGPGRRVLKWIAVLVGIGAALLATVVIVFALQARARLPDLHAWHRAGAQDFRVGAADAPTTFMEYRKLEDHLFADVRQRVLDDPAAADSSMVSRYNPHSVVAQLALDTIYNRSYELVPAGDPRGSVLLVHGLTDSPYSVRALAETFVAQGYYVVALRLPGHGTTPAGLVDVSWEDWFGAVTLAAKYAVSRGGQGKPFVAAGHSTGAALVTLYALSAAQDASLPRPDQLYLVSAAIGISPFAVLTNVLSGLSFIPGFEKAKWIDVLPEYDPYKYNSFPVNAANQIYKLTHVVQETIGRLTPGQLAGMPRIHVYQSIVDSTVTANQVVRGLLMRLPARNHELVVFDINRRENIQSFIAPGPLEDLERIRSTVDLPFRLTVIANRTTDSRGIAAYIRDAGSSAVMEKDLPYEWPTGVFSVGHVSLPFPVDDPVYGLSAGKDTKFNLGAISARGESGALTVGLGTFARLRSNPFFDVIRANVVASLAPAALSQ